MPLTLQRAAPHLLVRLCSLLPCTLSYWKWHCRDGHTSQQYFCFLSLRQTVTPFLHTTVGWPVAAMHRITAGCACLQCAWRIRHCRWWFELPVKGALSTLIRITTFSCPYPRPRPLFLRQKTLNPLLTCSQILASGRPQECIRTNKIWMKASCHQYA